MAVLRAVVDIPSSNDSAPSVEGARIEAELRALVKRHAPWAVIRFERHGARPYGVSWDGNVLRTTGRTYESVIHEVAHLLLSPPERIRLPEFGLGPDPCRRGFVERVTSREEADLEEHDACVLQLLIVRILGLDEPLVRNEYGTAPLTREVIEALRRGRPHALPEAWWKRALAPERA